MNWTGDDTEECKKQRLLEQDRERFNNSGLSMESQLDSLSRLLQKAISESYKLTPRAESQNKRWEKTAPDQLAIYQSEFSDTIQNCIPLWKRVSVMYPFIEYPYPLNIFATRVAEREKVARAVSLKMYKEFPKALHALALEFRDTAIRSAVQKKAASQKRAATENMLEAEKFVDKLTRKYQSFKAVRLSLSYSNDSSVDVYVTHQKNDVWKEELTKHLRDQYAKVCADRVQLLRYFKQTFKEKQIGFAWRLKYNFKGVYQYDVMLFLNSDVGDSPENMAKSLGEYWVNIITDKTGIFWNMHTQENQRARPKLSKGIGLIDSKDKIQHCKNALADLAKSDLYVRYLLPDPKSKTFSKSTAGLRQGLGRPKKLL